MLLHVQSVNLGKMSNYYKAYYIIFTKIFRKKSLEHEECFNCSIGYYSHISGGIECIKCPNDTYLQVVCSFIADNI